LISKEELDRTILELEAKDTTFANCERLCWLYTVRDHLTGQQTAQPTPLDISGDSEFLQAVNGKDSVQVWKVMDELLDTLKVTNVRLHDAVIRKINQIE
jgi:hypothetical protein